MAPPGRTQPLRDFRLTPTACVDRVDVRMQQETACVVDDLLAVGRVVRIVATLRDFGLTSPVSADRVDRGVPETLGAREGDPPAVGGVVGE